MRSPFHVLERAKLFKKFSLAVDEMETYRKNIGVEHCRDSRVLSELYIKCDSLIGRLKRLGEG